MSDRLFNNRRLNLQLFADGAGAGEAGTGAEGTSGVSAGDPHLQSKGAKNPLADVQYGIQDAQAAAVQNADEPNNVVDRKAEFEKLIKGEYKDLYDAKVQDTVQRRFKGSREAAEKYNAMAPTLEMLSRKYGVDASDIDALNKAIMEDDAYYEEEAAERGISVSQLKSIRKMERENADLKRQIREHSARENADRLYASWMEQSNDLKSVYPGFDLNAELKNQRFTDLLRNNVDVRTAYEVIHKDEIIPAAMQFTAKQVEQKLTNKIIASGARPAENGIGSQSSAVVKSDVSQLSREDRAEIIRRVARGEKIRF